MVLVLGNGNWLLSDDDAGAAAIERLSSHPHLRSRASCEDGRNSRRALLPKIGALDAVIAIGAGERGVPAGTVQVFLGEKMDAQPRGRKKTVHEVAPGAMFAPRSTRHATSPLALSFVPRCSSHAV